MTYRCKCCSSQAVPGDLAAREMMYGTREPFLYHACASCGSLQIAEVPDDMSVHYRNDAYSSWQPLPPHVKRQSGALQSYLRRRRTSHALGHFDPLGAMLTWLYGPPEFPFDWWWFTATRTRFDSRILDFGCGTGNLLYFLRRNGFKHLIGFDKFSPTRCDEPDLFISDELACDVAGRCHLVMFHHSLEHVAEPTTVLEELKQFMTAGGYALVRIPVAGSFVADEYGADWVQLDAPRHLVIPSEQGMRALSAGVGLKVVAVRYDSTIYQFIGSEQYRADIPMYDKQRSWLLRNPSPFTEADRSAFAKQAQLLNEQGRGDQACFVLQREG